MNPSSDLEISSDLVQFLLVKKKSKKKKNCTNLVDMMMVGEGMVVVVGVLSYLPPFLLSLMDLMFLDLVWFDFFVVVI